MTNSRQRKLGILIVSTLLLSFTNSLAQEERPRARDIGLEIGIFETGALNANIL